MEKEVQNLILELEQGRELVIVPPESAKDNNASLFWKASDGTIHAWNRPIGYMVYPYKDKKHLVEHFTNMLKEGCSIYARGLA